jgi:hypothetical protein
MASDPYQGPVSLGASMYASLQRNTATFPSSPAAIPVPSTPNSPIAAKEQVAATASTNEPDLAMAKVLNPDTQLAFAQNVALKEDVAKHIAQFGKSVRTAVENTHRLLNLIRDSIKQDDPAAAVKLQTVDNLWAELEYLFKAADNAKIALPEFLVKHEENMGLYHASMLNETIQNSQAELNLQHKKVNIQYV